VRGRPVSKDRRVHEGGLSQGEHLGRNRESAALFARREQAIARNEFSQFTPQTFPRNAMPICLLGRGNSTGRDIYGLSGTVTRGRSQNGGLSLFTSSASWKIRKPHTAPFYAKANYSPARPKAPSSGPSRPTIFHKKTLSHQNPAHGGTRDVFFFGNGREIAQMSEFHRTMSIADRHGEQTNKVLAGIEARRLKFSQLNGARAADNKTKAH
jgi:hypothetical protein